MRPPAIDAGTVVGREQDAAKAVERTIDVELRSTVGAGIEVIPDPSEKGSVVVGVSALMRRPMETPSSTTAVDLT